MQRNTWIYKKKRNAKKFIGKLVRKNPKKQVPRRRWLKAIWIIVRRKSFWRQNFQRYKEGNC